MADDLTKYYGIACPQCGSVVGRPCVTRSGNPTQPHAFRVENWRQANDGTAAAHNRQMMEDLHRGAAVDDFTVDDNNVVVGVDREGKPYLAQLPLLTADELMMLHEAISHRMNELARTRADTQGMAMSQAAKADLMRLIDGKGAMLQSLDTAVLEARGSLR